MSAATFRFAARDENLQRIVKTEKLVLFACCAEEILLRMPLATRSAASESVAVTVID